jgi:hypothetical protein
MTKREAWRHLVVAVNAALASSTLSLGWVRDGEIVSDAKRGFVPGPPVAPVVTSPPTIYAVCGLELADHMLAGHHYRVCANESCGRLFSIQEGRSRYGGHRTDTVKFHTQSCKAAQSAREYRRRKAARNGRKKR